MLEITIAAVGKLKEKYWRDAAAEYAMRLGRYCRLSIAEAEDEQTPEGKRSVSPQVILAREGARLEKLIRPGTFLIVLAIDGKRFSSEGFSEKLASLKVSGVSHITFVIGGSLGLSDAVIKRANEKISLSKMTFPHQLARVLLLEQIYRGCKINAGEKYHK